METPYICPTSHDIIVPLIFAMKNHPSNRYIQVFLCNTGSHNNKRSQFIEGFLPFTITPFCRNHAEKDYLRMKTIV